MGGPAYIGGVEYEEFDNFYPCPILFKALTYPTVEHAFQAAKTLVTAEREKFTDPNVSAGKAWEMGQDLVLRSDWEDVKVFIMWKLVGVKLSTYEGLVTKLIKTKDPIIFESSTDFWNEKNGKIYEHWRDYFKFRKNYH